MKKTIFDLNATEKHLLDKKFTKTSKNTFERKRIAYKYGNDENMIALVYIHTVANTTITA